MSQMNDTAAPKDTPKGIEVMAGFLEAMGIQNYEKGLLNQMTELTQKFVSNVIEDAKTVSKHAKKQSIDSEDIRLALRMQRTTDVPPDREVIVDMARKKNNAPLPTMKSGAGLRLPADRFSLTGCNYHRKSVSKKAKAIRTASWLDTHVPFIAAIQGSNKSGLITPPNSTTTPVVTKPVSNVPKVVTTSIIEPMDENRTVTSTTSPHSTVISTSAQQPTSQTHVSVPTNAAINADIKLSTDVSPHKRKLEDDDYDAI